MERLERVPVENDDLLARLIEAGIIPKELTEYASKITLVMEWNAFFELPRLVIESIARLTTGKMETVPEWDLTPSEETHVWRRLSDPPLERWFPWAVKPDEPGQYLVRYQNTDCEVMRFDGERWETGGHLTLFTHWAKINQPARSLRVANP